MVHLSVGRGVGGRVWVVRGLDKVIPEYQYQPEGVSKSNEDLMVKNLYIFGNGIGRAINADFFDLTRALQRSWSEDGLLTEEQKKLIVSCLPTGVLERDNQAPTNEDELEDLQRVLSACDTIKEIEGRDLGAAGWLSDHGKDFPVAVRKYLHKAACYFHNRDELFFQGDGNINLPIDFKKKLRASIMKAGAHIATLNYDDLLYETFVGTDVFSGHRLRDGFFNGIFDIEKHQTYMDLNPNQEGWFLHLHGSPLFVTQNGVSRKLTRFDLRDQQGIKSTHLVLTNVKYKMSAIGSSDTSRVLA
jgi:hypothetical protein